MEVHRFIIKSVRDDSVRIEIEDSATTTDRTTGMEDLSIETIGAARNVHLDMSIDISGTDNSDLVRPALAGLLNKTHFYYLQRLANATRSM